MQQEYLQYMHKDGTLICYNVKPSFILGSLDSRPWQNKGKWEIEQLNRNGPMLNIRLHLKTVVLSGSLIPQQSKVIVLAIETRYFLTMVLLPKKCSDMYT